MLLQAKNFPRPGASISGASISRALVVALALASALASMVPTQASGALAMRRAPTSDFEAASREEEAAVAAVLAVRAQREALEVRLRELDGLVRAAGDRARERAADLVLVDQAEQELVARLLGTQLRLERAQVRARRAAVQIYRGAGNTASPILDLMDGRGSVRDVSAGQRYLAVVGDRIARDLHAVKVARRGVTSAHRRLRAQRVEVERAAGQARREQDAVVAIRGDQDQALAAARAKEASENRMLAAARSRREEFERAAAVAQAASGTIEEILRARPATGAAPQKLGFPADGPVTSQFGPRVHPIFHTVRLHAGIDIGAGYGADVRAAGSGSVVLAGTASGYGTAVVIDHGGGVATLYGHLSRARVTVGQSLNAGQTIGAVGNTGNSTGPHLHFEVRVRGVPVDPMQYL